MYAAFGKMGCHTYLDYYPKATARHKDDITKAWYAMTTSVAKTNYGVNPANNVEHYRLFPECNEPQECISKVGAIEEHSGKIIMYAALGKRGCHTYLDYHP